MKIPAATPLTFLKPSETVSPANISPSFGNWLADKVNETNTKLLAADEALQNLATGKSTSLHETMLSMEEAKISFQFLEQIRNRLMSAYQEILKEPI